MYESSEEIHQKKPANTDFKHEKQVLQHKLITWIFLYADLYPNLSFINKISIRMYTNTYTQHWIQEEIEAKRQETGSDDFLKKTAYLKLLDKVPLHITYLLTC